MRKLALISCALVSLSSTRASEQTFLKQDFELLFQSASVERNYLILRLATNAPSLVHPTDDGRAEVIQAGHSVSIPFSKKAELIERHSGIIFDPLPAPLNSDGFSVQSYFDSTSVGGSKTVKNAFLVKVADNSNTPSELRWLPPDTPITEIGAIVHGQKAEGERISTNSPPATSAPPTATVHPADENGSRANETSRSPVSSAHRLHVDWWRRYAPWAGIGVPVGALLVYFWKRSR